jgi:hypothetical protein
LNLRKTERLRGGEDLVGFVRDELALDLKRDFLGYVKRSSGRNRGRSMVELMPVTKDRLVECAVEGTWEVEQLRVLHLGDVVYQAEV